MIQQSPDNALRRAGFGRSVATVITQVRADPTDQALQYPTKFIGRALTPEQARKLRDHGHSAIVDDHGNIRRVVGSPTPLGIRELPAVRRLVEDRVVVVACGGGGVPVHEHPTLGWEGIDAVIDGGRRGTDGRTWGVRRG